MALSCSPGSFVKKHTERPTTLYTILKQSNSSMETRGSVNELNKDI